MLAIVGISPGLAVSAAGIPGVVAPGTAVELVQEGFQFTEGPVGTPDGGLYFTDNRANRIYFLDISGKITVAHENTNNANGLVLTRDGDLLEAQGVGKRVNKRSRSGTVTTLTEKASMASRLWRRTIFSPTPRAVSTSPIRVRGPVVPGRKAFGITSPLAAKEPIVIDDELVRPNGLILTADGKTLLVNDFRLSQTFYAYDVEADGKVKNKRPFAKLLDIPAGKESGADGMAIDRDGRVYVTSVAGVQIFDAGGQYLGTVQAPRQTSNVAFSGPDKRTLYITARERLYRVKTLAQGPDRIGK